MLIVRDAVAALRRRPCCWQNVFACAHAPGLLCFCCSWVIISVMVTLEPTMGGGIRKSFHRVLGTLAGGLAGLAALYLAFAAAGGKEWAGGCGVGSWLPLLPRNGGSWCLGSGHCALAAPPGLPSTAGQQNCSMSDMPMCASPSLLPDCRRVCGNGCGGHCGPGAKRRAAGHRVLCTAAASSCPCAIVSPPRCASPSFAGPLCSGTVAIIAVSFPLFYPWFSFTAALPQRPQALFAAALLVWKVQHPAYSYAYLVAVFTMPIIWVPGLR